MLVVLAASRFHRQNLRGHLPEETLGYPVVFWEIVGPDANALRDFYTRVCGWTSQTPEMLPTYHYLSTDGVTEKQGAIRQEKDGPDRVLYIGVPDVQAALDRVTENGGTVVLGPMEYPGVPTFALFKDPGGNVTGLLKH